MKTKGIRVVCSDMRGRTSRQRAEEVQKYRHGWCIKEEEGTWCGWSRRTEWGPAIQAQHREPAQGQAVLGLVPHSEDSFCLEMGSYCRVLR